MEIKIYNNQGRPLTDDELTYLEKLIDHYLVDIIKTSEGFAVRAFMIGRIIAEYARLGLTAEDIEVATMPLTIKALAQRLGKLSLQERYAVEFAKQRAAENITDMTNEIKGQVRDVIRRGLQERKNALSVASDLFGKFKELDRDWRRIAITEANTATSEGYMRRLLHDAKIMDNKDSMKLIGQSAVDACPWCKANIHGKVFTLISNEDAPTDKPDDPKWDTYLWPGKNNIDRAYSKRKWVENAGGTKTLVQRSSSELAKPCFSAHPNCRCWYIPYYEGMPVGKDGYIQ